MPKGRYKNAVLFTDDFSRSGIRPAMLDRMFHALVRFFLERTAKARLVAGSTLVSGEEALSLPFGVSEISYGKVLIQGVTRSSASELIQMIEVMLSVIKPVSSWRSKSGVAVADVLAFRHFVSFLQECVLRSIAPLSYFLEKLTTKTALVTDSGSSLELIVEHLAKSRGLRCEKVPAPLVLRFSAWVKARFSLKKLVPDYDQISELWGAFSSESESSVGQADVLVFCEEERRMERAAELLGIAGKRSRILAAPFKLEARRKAEQLRADGLPISYLPAFIDADERARIQPIAIIDAEQSWKALGSSDRVCGCSFLGVPVWKIFHRKMHVGFEPLSLVAAFSLAAAENCIDRLQPKRLIIVDNGLYSKALQEVARARGIPVLWYSDNPILSSTVYWPEFFKAFFPLDGVIASSAFIASRMCKKFGFSEERVFLAGAPAVPQKSVLAGSSPRQGRGTVLALSTYVTMDISAECRRRFHLLVANAAKLAGYDLVIRAHPNESLDGLKRDLNDWGIKPVFLSQKESLQEVLARVDMACMIFSQAGLEVLRAEKPLFAIQEVDVREAYEAFVPYAGSGSAVAVDPKVTGPEWLAAKFDSLIVGPERERSCLAGRQFYREYASTERDPLEIARLENYLRSY